MVAAVVNGYINLGMVTEYITRMVLARDRNVRYRNKEYAYKTAS